MERSTRRYVSDTFRRAIVYYTTARAHVRERQKSSTQRKFHSF